MKRRWTTAAALLFAVLAGILAPATMQAQGVTTSAISGRVTNAEGEPVAGAQIVAVNTATGTESRVVTRADGRYLLTGLQPGGPYRITATALGLASQSRESVQLALSQTATFDFALGTQAVLLEGLTVAAERNAVISSGRTGAATVVSDSAIARMPTITRDFTDFTRLVPQLSTGGAGTSAGGRNNRFNSIQIDGAVNNDLFGLAASGTPGGQAGTKPITLEAIQEFQVVLAPFDVRQGGFTGAGINAVTRSGTNDFRGSLAGFGRNESLVGNYRIGDSESSSVADFRQIEGAFSLGGPIVRDRAFFFVAGELARRQAPHGAFVGASQTGTTHNAAQIDEVANVLRTQYGYDPGSAGLATLKRESDNVFARFDLNLGRDHRLTARHNYVNAWDDNLSRSDGHFQMSNAGYVFNSKTNATVMQLNSTLGNQLFNEFRLGWTTVRDNREVPATLFPRVEVNLNGCAGSSCRVITGSENFSVANALDQDVLEITNDLSFSRGIHSFTVGTRNEFFRFSNLFARNLYGRYLFNSIQALRDGTPTEYEYSFFNENVPGAARRAEFPVQQLSLYAQDRLTPVENVTLTAGIRFDMTRFPDPPGRNPQFESAFPNLNRSTDQIPENSILFNPRLGFNWDVFGDRTTQVRGGVGLFSGRTPYVWVSNAYGNTGLDYTRFTCRTSDANNQPPAFSANPQSQPQACLNALGQPNIAAVPNEINLVSPNFRMPQILRYSLAVDRELALGLIGTLEGIYTDSRNDPHYRDLTIGAPTGATVEGRPVYSRTTASGFGNIYDMHNTSANYAYSVTGQLQRPFSAGWEASLAYTYGRSYDVNSLTSSQASSNFRFNPIDTNPNNPSVSPSNYDVPHRIVGSFTRQFTFVRRAPTDISFVYVGESGRPYSFTYSGDINNDGSNANDLIYVPANASEARFAPATANQPITPAESWENLNDFIDRVDCLRAARGTVIERNACRQPWSNRIDVRVAQSLATIGAQSAQITVDVLNFANMLNSEWGRSEFVPNQNDVLLVRSGNTLVGERVLLNAFRPKPNQFLVSDFGSRYQIQLGARYSF
jgi:hypothetical protein